MTNNVINSLNCYPLLVALLLLLAFILAISIEEDRNFKKVAPSLHTLSLESLQKGNVEIIAKKTVFRDAEMFTVVLVRQPKSYLALPSGPVVYVYNSKGHLIDWSRDFGDDPGFWTNWNEFTENN